MLPETVSLYERCVGMGEGYVDLRYFCLDITILVYSRNEQNINVNDLFDCYSSLIIYFWESN